MKQSYSVKAILRTDKKRIDETCPIYYRVTIDSKVLKLPSGEYANENQWNKKDFCFKSAKSSVENGKLDASISKIKDYIREQNSIGLYVSIESVKEFYTSKSSNDFFNLFDEYCERKFLEIAPGTQKHYTLIRKRLKEFKRDIKLHQIDLKFIEDFDTFLRRKSVISDSGLFNRHKNFKTFLHYAVKRKLIKSNPYEDFKSPKCRQKFDHLTSSEIEAIKELSLLGNRNEKGLTYTRDMFLFGCYTGLRCSDVQNLKWKNIINMEYMSITTQKTQKKANLPLTKGAVEILKKYKQNGDEKVFPFRTNECLNRDLKKIATLCEINKVITFHMSRHSFGTILANNNVNAFQISQMMTHSTMKQTMTYVNSGVGSLQESINTISVFN
ncbi:MAG TPA: site-specific integrase [Flavobacterium sp.]